MTCVRLHLWHYQHPLNDEKSLLCIKVKFSISLVTERERSLGYPKLLNTNTTILSESFLEPITAFTSLITLVVCTNNCPHGAAQTSSEYIQSFFYAGILIVPETAVPKMTINSRQFYRKLFLMVSMTAFGGE